MNDSDLGSDTLQVKCTIHSFLSCELTDCGAR